MKSSLYFLLILIIALLACSKPYDGAPKNVIILIGDGMGYNQVQAGSLYLHGREDALTAQQFPVQRAVSTFSASGHGYDPQRVQKDFDYLKLKPTDSAAAATALAAGVKTRNGAVGVDTLGRPLENIFEKAEKLGKSTGVVTSVPFSHATPAGFVAHDTSRANYHAIAAQMVASNAEVIIGCGHPFYNDDGERLNEPDYHYLSVESWQALREGADGWTLVESRDDFKAVDPANRPQRLFGVAQVASTLQFARRGAEEQTVPFNPPLIETVPTLAEMTGAALAVLEANDSGFYLMIEGGAIDWAGHANHSPRLIEEMVDLEAAIQAVVDWVERSSSWQETLVIVTADHETGYLTGPGAGNMKTEGGEEAFYADLANRGRGQLPSMEWQVSNHTNQLVPLYAKGAGAEGLTALAKLSDPLRGRYLDNIDIPNYLKTFLIR